MSGSSTDKHLVIQSKLVYEKEKLHPNITISKTNTPQPHINVSVAVNKGLSGLGAPVSALIPQQISVQLTWECNGVTCHYNKVTGIAALLVIWVKGGFPFLKQLCTHSHQTLCTHKNDEKVLKNCKIKADTGKWKVIVGVVALITLTQTKYRSKTRSKWKCVIIVII